MQSLPSTIYDVIARQNRLEEIIKQLSLQTQTFLDVPDPLLPATLPTTSLLSDKQINSTKLQNYLSKSIYNQKIHAFLQRTISCSQVDESKQASHPSDSNCTQTETRQDQSNVQNPLLEIQSTSENSTEGSNSSLDRSQSDNHQAVVQLSAHYDIPTSKSNTTHFSTNYSSTEPNNLLTKRLNSEDISRSSPFVTTPPIQDTEISKYTPSSPQKHDIQAFKSQIPNAFTSHESIAFPPVSPSYQSSSPVSSTSSRSESSPKTTSLIPDSPFIDHPQYDLSNTPFSSPIQPSPDTSQQKVASFSIPNQVSQQQSDLLPSHTYPMLSSHEQIPQANNTQLDATSSTYSELSVEQFLKSPLPPAKLYYLTLEPSSIDISTIQPLSSSVLHLDTPFDHSLSYTNGLHPDTTWATDLRFLTLKQPLYSEDCRRYIQHYDGFKKVSSYWKLSEQAAALEDRESFIHKEVSRMKFRNNTS